MSAALSRDYGVGAKTFLFPPFWKSSIKDGGFWDGWVPKPSSVYSRTKKKI